MDYPSEEVMQTLGALALGEEFRLSESTGQMAVRIDADNWVEVDGDHWDQLSARGWVEQYDKDGKELVEITQSGMYWLDRWLKKNKKSLVRRVT